MFCASPLLTNVTPRPISNIGYKQRTGIEYLIVEDAVVIDSGEENSWLQEITLISCFSWYLESLHISFRLVELIHNDIVPVTVFHPANGEFAPISETDFITHIRSVYDDKWEWFKNMYNGFHKPVLPFEFYDRWQNRHPWWLQWFTN
jgi:hypothetical protein